MSDLNKILKELKIKADIESFEINANVSNYYLRLHSGSTVNKIEKYSTEIALGMRSVGRPIVKTILDRGLVQLEFLNNITANVSFQDIQHALKASTAELPMALGRSYDGTILVEDLANHPHLLLAGTTGSGKSTALHSIINGLIYARDNVKFVMIDPKIVELAYYKSIKQQFLPLALDYESAYNSLERLVAEMNARYELFLKKGVSNIKEYNKKRKMDYLVVIIDEFADLIMAGKKELQKSIALLAQKGRSCGIHLIISTQRPSSQIINGLIKANFPARLCFKVSSAIDSRIVLEQNGAEKLNGLGDGILTGGSYKMLRFKGCYISPEEIQNNANLNKKSLVNRWFGG